MRLHWHRRDLRLTDNRGLAAAPDRPVGIFVFDDSVLEHAGAPRVAFMLDALEKLRAAYRNRGADLLIRQGNPASVLHEAAERYDAEFVSWNRDYSGLAQERDERVSSELKSVGVAPSSSTTRSVTNRGRSRRMPAIPTQSTRTSGRSGPIARRTARIQSPRWRKSTTPRRCRRFLNSVSSQPQQPCRPPDPRPPESYSSRSSKRTSSGTKRCGITRPQGLRPRCRLT